MPPRRYGKIEMVKMSSAAATIRNDIHTCLFNIIKNDPTVKSFTKNIYDGLPYDIFSKGFPYIIVRTPKFSTKQRISLTNKYENIATFQINIVTQKESVVRQLTDAVDNALSTNQDTTRAANLNWMNLNSGDPIPSTALGDEEGKSIRVWTITLTAEFRVALN